jgi:serine/threonine protein kinase
MVNRLILTDDESISDFFLDQSFEQRYTEQNISRISALLRSVDDGAWSNIPRLYIVLRRIGLLELRDHFISKRITDANFPLSDSSFPSIMGPLQRSAFLQMQHCVLTDATQAGKCEWGEHAHFADPEQIPFRMETILGTGGFAQVEKVVSTITFRQYARKLFHRRTFGRFQDSLVDFVNELNALKRVRHRHIVEIVGSYTDPRYAALIMSPVADCDLSDFLKMATSLRRNMSLLRTFFGCLATAVSHLHSVRIRHKDIKPHNILVKDGTVLLTDFGISRDCNNTRSTTEGPTARSPRYCAPEVADDSPRSFSSDIWSLGCVYLEMISVLKGYSLGNMTAFFDSNGSQTRAFWANPRGISGWMTQLSDSQAQEPDNMPLAWIEQMLRHDRSRRPSASALAAEITSHRSASDRIGEFCGICCRIEDEPFADPSGALASSLGSLNSPVLPTVEDPSEIAIASASNSIPNETQRKYLI